MKKTTTLLVILLMICSNLFAQKRSYDIVFDITSKDTVDHKLVLRLVNEVLQADLDQAEAYARDLKNYHSMCHDVDVEPVLVPTRWQGSIRSHRHVTVCPPRDLDRLLVQFSKRGRPDFSFDPLAWIDGEYAPLPGIVQAARDLYHKRPLPFIKRAQSARLPEVHTKLVSIAHEAARGPRIS